MTLVWGIKHISRASDLLMVRSGQKRTADLADDSFQGQSTVRIREHEAKHVKVPKCNTAVNLGILGCLCQTTANFVI